MSTVVGVDLSLTATGIAWNDGGLRLHGRAGLTGVPLMQRGGDLHSLACELHDIIRWGQIGRPVGVVPDDPALVLIETLPTARTQVQAERAYVWHELVRQLAAYGDGVPVVDVTPGQIKQYATGSGSAIKGKVIDACARRFPAFETGGDENLADATVLAAIGADLLGLPLAGDDDRGAGWRYRVPRDNRKALAKIALPEGVERGDLAA